MIVYDHNTWLGSLTRIRGTVMSSIFIPVVLVGAWAWIVLVIANGPYPAICQLSKDVTSTHKMLGTFVSFFLIFRTNQAYIRYWQCNETLKLIQIGTRELHSQFLIYMKGGHSVKGKDDAAYQKMERTALQAKLMLHGT
jgi:predicted membrane chloride channel (bestrophin family)